MVTSISKTTTSYGIPSGIDLEMVKPVTEQTAAFEFFRQQQLQQEAAQKVDIKKVTAEINRGLQMIGTRISLSFDSDTKKNIIRVMDSQTNEVIRQIPSEELLNIAKRLDDLLGVFFDESR